MLLEMCRGSGLAARIAWATCRCCRASRRWRESGIGTGASLRNWASYGGDVDLPPGLPEWRRGLLCDPQTSGGLLIAAAADAVAAVIETVRAAGFHRTVEIGRLAAGLPRITVAEAGT